MTITTVFFDVGNTLLTPSVSEAEVFCEMAARTGAVLEPSAVEQHMPEVYRFYEELYEQDDSFWASEQRATAIWVSMYEYLCELCGLSTHAREIARLVHGAFFGAGFWKPFDDVMPVLEGLKQRGIRMGLISNWDSSLESIIKGLGLDGYFEVIISSSVVELHKPKPEIFELALSRMGARAEQAMHVGDHIQADVAGAQATGITPVLIDRTQHYPADCAPFVIRDLRELMNHLEPVGTAWRVPPAAAPFTLSPQR